MPQVGGTEDVQKKKERELEERRALTLLRAALPIILTRVHTVSMWKSSLPGAGAGGSLLAHQIMRSVAQMWPPRRTNSSCDNVACH